MYNKPPQRRRADFKTYTTEVLTRVGQSNTNFNRHSSLSQKRIVGISVFAPVEGSTVSRFSPTGVPLVNIDAFASMYVEILRENQIILNKLSLPMIAEYCKYNQYYPVNIDNTDIDRSHIVCGNTAALADNESVVMTFWVEEDI
jgi:hypothetical protein